jgi:predicted nucleic-acid-binding protein
MEVYMMENNQQGFNMESYNELIKKINSGSPVHKINFSIESPNAIIGMYLMAMPSTEEYLKNKADFKDLTEDTLLSFEHRHVVECCQILYGSMNILENINLLKHSSKFIINRIISSLLTRPLFYKDALQELDIIANQAFNLNQDSEKIYKNFKYIIDNIWFVPYGLIDEMINEAIEEFNKTHGDNNEGNG